MKEARSAPKTKFLKPVNHCLVLLKSDKEKGRRKKHHLVIFKLPNGYAIQLSSLKSTLPFSCLNWHKCPRAWKWVSWASKEELEEKYQVFLSPGSWGVLVPRTFFWIWKTLTCFLLNSDWIVSHFRVKAWRREGLMAEERI